MNAQELYRSFVVSMYLDDYDRFRHVVKGCIQLEISHTSIVTTQDATNENIPKYYSSGFYGGIGSYFICRFCLIKVSRMFYINIMQPSLELEANNLNFVLKIFLRKGLLLSLEISFRSSQI